jgi:predicted PolB exonuclease-like 3'-5' exonuclease
MSLKTVVLDIETVPNQIALDRLAAMRTEKAPELGGYPKWILQRIVAASALCIDADSHCPEIELRSWHRGTLSEAAIVAGVEAMLERANILVTFNGRAHDLPVLRARALAARWLAVPKIAGFRLPKSTWHIDLSEELCGRGSARPSLAETAALLNLPAKRQLVGTSVPALAAADNYEEVARHCESDVVTTYLVHLHLRMSDAGADEAVADASATMTAWLKDCRFERPHLQPFIVACERMARLRPADEQELPALDGLGF